MDIQLEEYLVFLAKPFYRFCHDKRSIRATRVKTRFNSSYSLGTLLYEKSRFENIVIFWLVLVEQSKIFPKYILQSYAIE